MKKKASDASIEEILSDLLYWEDPEQALIIGPLENGGVYVQNLLYEEYADGKTLHEALLKFGENIIEQYDQERLKLNWKI